MQKGYLAAAALLVLGLAGVGTLALQASQRLGAQGEPQSGDDKKSGGADRAGRSSAQDMDARLALGPETRPRGEGPSRPIDRDLAARPGPDAGLARPDPSRPGPAAPDAGAGAARPGPDATPTREAPREAPRDAPREAPRDPGPPPAEGPPRPEGPEPVMVIELEEGRAKPSAADFRRVRDLVDKHGYKDLTYRLTGFAGELSKAKYNRGLARQRCQQVLGLFRRRGVSRRWLACQDPVYRDKDGAPTEAHRAPAWRRVEVRVTK